MAIERHSSRRHHRRSWSKRVSRAWEKLPYRRKRSVIKLLVGIGVSLMAILTGVVVAQVF
jgi:hypothetical protein